MASGLLTIGLTTMDIVARAIDALTHTERAIFIDGIAATPAGTAGGAAMVAARLGLPVKIVGAVGDDLMGAYVRLGFESVGVDASLLAVRKGERTSTTLLTVESDGTRSSYHAPGAGVSAAIDDAVTAAACDSRFVHYAAIGGRTTDGGQGAALLSAAKAAGAIVTCDLIGPRGSALEELKRLLPFVDYFMPSAAEATFLTGLEDVPAAAERFRALGAGACIIKTGAAGSFASIGDERRVIPAHAIEPVDTTTCGDSYCAGFIAALDRDWPPLEACRFATATAALVAQGLASLGKLESFQATEAAMREASAA
jgi:sugar/nucleoside kinase (ribokinase family)